MRRIYAMALCLVLLMSLSLLAFSAGGDEADPVVSLSYLKTVFAPAFAEEAQALAETRLNRTYNGALLALAEKTARNNRAAADRANAAGRKVFGKVNLKQGDLLRPMAGCRVTLLSGTVLGSESLINVTAGSVCGAQLQRQTLYMQSDAPSAGLAVESATAEVLLAGAYTLTPSAAADYGSLADALSQMGLFRGMTDGYQLEGSTTRAQGLVMFLRLLGKEEAALATRGQIPFADVPQTHWSRPYVVYAYENGLTTGVTETAFSPDAPMTAQQYMTFLLRALHYAEGKDFAYNTVLDDAVTLGLFAKQETDVLSQGSFLRHKMVYLSYYGLFCAHGETSRLLLEDLIAAGAVTEKAAYSGLATARGWRMAP